MKSSQNGGKNEATFPRRKSGALNIFLLLSINSILWANQTNVKGPFGINDRPVKMPEYSLN